VLYGGNYWREIINFEALVRHGMIDPKDLELFKYADSPSDACALLQSLLQADTLQAGPSFARSRTRQSDDA
jgi:predicted Rossmann-fold nucleotide-binding protein